MEKLSNKTQHKSKIKPEVCRLCFQNEGNLTSLKEKRKNTTILDFLKEISSSKFDNLEKTSDKICSKCLKRIEDAIEFMDMFKNSENGWSHIFNSTINLGDEKKSEEPENVNKTIAVVPLVVKIEEIEDDDGFFGNYYTANSPSYSDDNFDDSEFFKSMETEENSSAEQGKERGEEEKLYRCSALGCRNLKRFKTMDEMKSHNQQIHQKVMLPCSYPGCDKIYELKANLLRHEDSHKPIEERSTKYIFKCPFPGCNVEYYLKKNVIKHGRLAHHGWNKTYETTGLKLSCSFCDKRFAQTYSLKEHERVHILGTNPFECDICGSKLSSRKCMVDHVKFSHLKLPQEMFSCEYCGKQFPKFYFLRDHVNYAHTKEISYQCGLCPKKYHSKIQLTVHKFNSHSEKTYKCDHCDRIFQSNHAKTKHMRCHTGKYPFRCTHADCGRGFNHSSNFKKHMAAHISHAHLLKRFRCFFNGCEKVFNNPQLKKLHEIKYHGVDRSAFPGIEPTPSKSQSSTQPYVPIGSTNRSKYKCSFSGCDKEFVKYRSAKYHEREKHFYSDQKVGDRYKCIAPDCQQDFATKLDLFYHEFLHQPEDERIFDTRVLCNFPGCDRKFRRTADLLRHKQSHLPAEERAERKKPFKCSVDGCNKAYPWKQSLKKHLKNTHKIAMEN